MSRSAQIAVALGVLCALLVGVLVGGRLGTGSEADRFYSRANRTLDLVSPETGASTPLQEKTKLMADTMTISVAAFQCAGDHGGTMPGPIGFAEKVRPYMDKTKPDRLSAFEWKFKGGSELAVPAPEATELGRLTGQAGAAVAYLDGHNEWKPK